MEFDWPLAIDRNSEALCAIAARLIVMAGIQAGRTVATLPRHLYWRILGLLRPAEYAARRLIVMAACKLDWTVPALRRHSAVPAGGATAPAGDTPEPADGFATDEDNHFPPALPPDEPVCAKALCRRIRALADALSDLDGQALRLARWRARRHMESARPRRWSPLRPGRPPGYRKRPKRPVEELLKDCHILALDAWDTS